MISFAEPVVRSHRPSRGPCPSYFRACCIEASRGNAHGVRVGYDHPGFQLTIHLEREQPYEVDDEAWMKAIDELVDLIEAANDDKIIDWFCYWLPRCMALVPRRRRKMFVRGVYRAAVQNEWICEMPDSA